VTPLVLLKRRCFGKMLLAELALEWFVTRVHLQVPAHLLLAGKSFISISLTIAPKTFIVVLPCADMLSREVIHEIIDACERTLAFTPTAFPRATDFRGQWFILGYSRAPLFVCLLVHVVLFRAST